MSGQMSQSEFQSPKIPEKATSDSEPRLCGLSKVWALSPNHPFTKEACALHDRWYEMKEKKMETPGREAVDLAFFEAMKRIAEKRGSFILKAQAHVFYGLVKVFGRFVW